MAIEAGRLLTYQAATLKTAGEPFTTEAAMAKLFTSENAMRIHQRRRCRCSAATATRRTIPWSG